MIKNNLGQIRGITKRNDLLNANVSAEINMNYRLTELGFITNTSDMNWIKKNSDKYSKLIAVLFMVSLSVVWLLVSKKLLIKR